MTLSAYLFDQLIHVGKDVAFRFGIEGWAPAEEGKPIIESRR